MDSSLLLSSFYQTYRFGKPFWASITVQNMLPRPSSLAKLGNMTVGVVALVFDLCGLVAARVLQLSSNTKKTNKEGNSPSINGVSLNLHSSTTKWYLTPIYYFASL